MEEEQRGFLTLKLSMEELAYGKEAWSNIQKNFATIEEIYLDHAGTTLYPKSCIDRLAAELSSNIFGNPHSHSPSSKHTSDLIDQIRYSVLCFFNADPSEYSVIFTAGATHGLKIVAESFIFLHKETSHLEKVNIYGSFAYVKESHTSVVGMRECFKNHVPCFALPTDEVLKMVEQAPYFPQKSFIDFNFSEDAGKKTFKPSEDFNLAHLLNKEMTSQCNQNQKQSEKTNENLKEDIPNSLFVFPAQCNFSGFKYPLELIGAVQEGKLSALEERFCLNPKALPTSPVSNWFCLLDAASFAATNRLDLSKWKPDMVVISFYKIFGYPTGLGALIVNRRASQVLQKKYFGGGTVEMFSSSQDFYKPRDSLHERFEDGTSNFLSIIALRISMLEHKKMAKSMENVSMHTFFLAQYLYQGLRELKYSNGHSLVEVYAPASFCDPRRQGGIVTFNLYGENGKYIGYSQVDKVLALFGIHVRTGCFCNPGACQRYLQLTDDDVFKQYASGHKCGDENDLVDGKPTGAIRVSFGLMTTKNDVNRLVEVLRNAFLLETLKVERVITSVVEEASAPPQLVAIHVFPIKSCGAFSPSNWPVTKAGLLYDRQWVIVNEAGVVITQKREPKLCLIKPIINLSKNLLILSYEGVSSTVSIPLNPDSNSKSSQDIENSFTKVCGKMLAVQQCDAAVSEWLGNVLERPGFKLLRYDKKRDEKSSSFANEAPYLLINRNSVLSLQEQFEVSTPECSQADDFLLRFRANLVIDGIKPFEEEQSRVIRMRSLTFKNVGVCYRCQMICIDQNNATRNQKPLTALASYRGKKMPFGIQLELCPAKKIDSVMLHIGMPLDLLESAVVE